MTKFLHTTTLFLLLLSSATCMDGQSQHLDRQPVRIKFEPSPEAIGLHGKGREADTVRLCFLGDVMLHRQQLENALLPDGNPKDPADYRFDCFRFIREELEAADLAVANMEFTLAGPPFSGYPCFSAPDSYATYMADCGIDVFLTANNHILDKGSAGTRRTLEVYRSMEKSHGIRRTGCSLEGEDFPAPLTVRVRHTRIALLNFTYGTNCGKTRHFPEVNYLNGKHLDACFRKAEATQPDCMIALPHWGEEYQLLHSPEQEKTAQDMVTRGADLIIGAHPHVVQDRTTVQKNGKAAEVLYSLGNAVSNMSAPDTQIGLMAHVTLIRQINGDVRLLPVEVTWLWCSRPGGYNERYTVIPIERFLDRKEEWKNPWDFDKMISSWERIKKISFD